MSIEQKPTDVPQPQPNEWHEEEPVPEVKDSYLTREFGDEAFVMTERGDQGSAVERREDGVLSFDAAVLDTAEIAMIQEFLAATETPEALAASKRFGWFFAEESWEFVQQLRTHLANRLKNGAEKARADLKSLNLDDELKARIDSAAGFFREKAKREQIRAEMQTQISRLPFVVMGRDRRGQERELRYNPDNIFDPSNEVDFLYANHNGKPELLISCKVGIGMEIAGIDVLEAQPEWASKKPFALNHYEKVKDARPEDGVDSTYLEVGLGPSSDGQRPLFDTVRIYTAPMDMGAKIDELNQEKEAKRQAEEARKRNAQAAASRKPAQPYTSAPPSVPSTPQAPRWQAPSPTVIRSG
jgi:hypothetical protein